jgi:hypothetical protein
MKIKLLVGMTVMVEVFSCLAMQPLIRFPVQSLPPLYFATIETYFLPQAQEYIYERLTSFFDSAKKQILVAMYWLADEVAVNKLIDLKSRGIDVQIIFDESTPDLSSRITVLTNNNIIPVVSPEINGKMHNKFVVVDNAVVWTGSANFTKTVLKPFGNYFNDENIVIIHSDSVAEEYSKAFYFMETNIINYYIKSIAERDYKDLPVWLMSLCQRLYQSNSNFKELCDKARFQFDSAYQVKFRFLLPVEQTRLYRQLAGPTQKQKAYLINHGSFRPGMSKAEATELIGRMMSSDKQRALHKP